MADVALGAIELVVGIIRTEVQRHGEIEAHARFVADEMESMTSHLRDLVSLGAGASNHQARTWTKQVMEFAIDAKECVDEFKHSRSSGGTLGKLMRAAIAIWLNHPESAGEMKNLKNRARDIAERLQRYEVTIRARREEPEDPDFFPNNMPEEAFRRRILTGPYMVTEGVEELIRWLKKESGIEEREQWARVIAITDGANGDALAEQVYNRSSDEKLFDLKAHVTIQRPAHQKQVVLDMLSQLLGMDFTDASVLLENILHQNQELGKNTPVLLDNQEVETDATVLVLDNQEVDTEAPVLLENQEVETHAPVLQDNNQEVKIDASIILDNLPPYLKGRKLLVVFSGLDYPELWTHIKMALDKFQCSTGSAVMFSTKKREVAQRCSAMEFSLVGIHLKKAVSLSHAVPGNNILTHLEIIEEILEKYNSDFDRANMFLRALCSNPNWKERYLTNLLQSLGPDQSTESEMQDRMAAFCYEGLPKNYKICLWYSTFCIPRSYQAGRASLLRRWRAEGLITAQDLSSERKEAEHCFDTLITHKFLLPRKIGCTGKIKSYAVHHSTIDIISTKIPTVEDLVLTNQLPIDSDNMIFSLRNAFQLHQSISTNSTRQKHTLDFLEYLRASSTSRLVSVLDLEDYKDLTKYHLHNICKIQKLKYLSLRNTDVAKLPSEIENLELLQTLDIRQTRVQALKAFLPKLKHLLAGSTDHPSIDTNFKSGESFSTVRMPEPENIRRMEDMEILSHVKVYDSVKELLKVGEKLKKLRKLGVVLSGRRTRLIDLFRLIDRYTIDLRSLSIRMEQPGGWEGVDDTSLTLSGLLERLSICGIRGDLPHQIKELHRLAKITLRDTLLKENALDILGGLTGLRCLKVRYHSFAESTLIFGNGQFSSLMELVVEDDIITSITFSPETAPKLVTVIWSFAHMKFLSGVQKLPNLRHIEFNGGTCESVGLEELHGEIATQGNNIDFRGQITENGEGSGQLDDAH